MQKIIFTLALSVLCLISCQSNENKAKSLVEEYLSKTLNDYDSYQSVEWGSLDSLYSNFLISEEGRNTLKRFKFFLGLYEEIQNEEGDDFVSSRREYLDSAGVYQRRMDSLETNFIPEHIGWKLTHTYRAKNLNGAYRIAKEKYYFSMGLDSIVGTEEIED